jgi:hypothetical protein
MFVNVPCIVKHGQAKTTVEGETVDTLSDECTTLAMLPGPIRNKRSGDSKRSSPQGSMTQPSSVNNELSLLLCWQYYRFRFFFFFD